MSGMRGYSRLGGLCVVLTAQLCVGLAVAVPDALAVESRELSAQEQAELRAGKLVVRRTARRLNGVPMLGGLAWQRIRARPDVVYQTLIHVPSYPQLLPAVESVRLVPEAPPFTVFVQHRLGFIRGSYYVRTQRDAAHRTLRFRMDHEYPSSIRDAWGELQVTPYGRDESIVSLAILADLGDGLMLEVIRDNIQTWMLRVPELIKRHVERSVRAAAP